MGGQHAGQNPGLLVHDVVAQHDHEGLVANVFGGDRNGVAQSERFALADVVDVGHVGDGPHLVELVGLAALGQVVLQLEGPVEVVLDRSLAPSGDDRVCR